MPVKIWLPWKRQVMWTVTCHIKLLPENFWKKSPSLVAFALILKKLLMSKVAAGRIPPPHGLNRAQRKLKSFIITKNLFVNTTWICNFMHCLRFSISKNWGGRRLLRLAAP